MGWKVPIVSHWGPAGGRFTELAGPSAKNVHFVQTYSFFGKQSPVGEKVLKALMAKYPDIKGPADVTPAVGVANAYDAMHLDGARDRARPGSTDGDRSPPGLLQDRQLRRPDQDTTQAVHADNHDALNENDYVWTHSSTTEILPVDELTVSLRAARARRPAQPRVSGTMLDRFGARLSGFGLGSMYGLLALGFHVTYAVSSTVNFAQGSSMMLGAVFAYTFARDARLAAAGRGVAGAAAAARSTALWSSASRCGRSRAAARTPG